MRRLAAAVAERVLTARNVQQQRFDDGCSTPTNAAMSTESHNRHCVLEPDARRPFCYRPVDPSAGPPVEAGPVRDEAGRLEQNAAPLHRPLPRHPAP